LSIDHLQNVGIRTVHCQSTPARKATQSDSHNHEKNDTALNQEHISTRSPLGVAEYSVGRSDPCRSSAQDCCLLDLTRASKDREVVVALRSEVYPCLLSSKECFEPIRGRDFKHPSLPQSKGDCRQRGPGDSNGPSGTEASWGAACA